jgi:hypothetical protein
MTNETDRELLELAAKAAGLNNLIFNHGQTNAYHAGSLKYMTEKHHHTPWNPLNDDGDALRLAVDLKLGVTYGGKYFFDDGPMTFCGEYWDANESRYFKAFVKHESDPRAATRRAIVRAAAEIGKAMP